MSSDAVKFGNNFELDRGAYQLRRSGRILKLERIPMEILFLLLEQPGQLVCREDIISRIWGKDVFLDTDNSINSAIRKIRHVLKDDPENPVFIQTVTGKGYRFIASVTGTSQPASPPPAAIPDFSLATEPSPPLPPDPPRPRRRSTDHFSIRRVSVAVLLIIVLAAGVYFWRTRARPHPAPGQRRQMLAVLPFANLSGDPQQDYFSDGLTEETITDLGELNPQQLGIIARTSAMSYKHTTKTIPRIGRELGADYILEGSIRREGGSTRISAQLIRVKDQVHLWAHTYERETGGLLALQNELGRAIAQQVQIELAGPYGNRQASKYTPDPEAYELYLKGRFFLSKRTWPEVDESADYFQQAIKKDPSFALAYAGLADSYLANAVGAQAEFDPKAKAAASRALELDNNLAEAHTVLGVVKADFEYDWPGAEQEFKRAIAINPNYADAHYRYSWSYLTPLGRSQQAIDEMKKALELDPFSRTDNTILGCTYFYARRYDEASAQFENAIQLNPDFFVTYYHFAWLHSQTAQYPDAIAELTKGRLLAGDSHVKTAISNEIALKKALAAHGAAGFWQQIQMQSQRGAKPEIGEFGPAQVYAHLGDNGNALKALERSYQERESLGTLVNVDPAFDSLRSDPRFINLTWRMGLTQNVKAP